LVTDDVILKTPSSPPKLGREAVGKDLEAFHTA